MIATITIVAVPGPMAAMIIWLSLRVVEDHVERAAVAGDPRDRLRNLGLRRQQQRHGVEVLRPRSRRRRDLADARDDALRGVQDTAQEVHHDGCDDHEEDDVADPPENHFNHLSATIAALRPMPGNAPRMMSNWAL